MYTTTKLLHKGSLSQWNISMGSTLAKRLKRSNISGVYPWGSTIAKRLKRYNISEGC